MQSRLAWLLAGIGVAAAAMHRFLRTPAPPPPLPTGEPVQPEAPLEPDPRADELAQRIAEAREIVDEREEFEESETPVDAADPEARRRHVHERGRAALERMRREGEP
jgi:hypothetical protein